MNPSATPPGPAATLQAIGTFDRTALSSTTTKIMQEDGSCVVVANCGVGAAEEEVVERFKEARPSYLQTEAESSLDTRPARRFMAAELAADPAPMLHHLAEHGYVVVGACFTPPEVRHAHALVWDFLEARGVLRDDITTWGGDAWPADARTGIVSRHGFSHSDFCWHARENAHVRHVFALVNGCQDSVPSDSDGTGGSDGSGNGLQDMITSYDGGNLFRPWSHDKDWKTSGGWFHVDQNTKTGKIGRCCVQGVACFTDADASTGGLVVIPGSHKHHGEVCEAHGENKGDFVPIGRDDPILHRPGRLVTCKAGDLILWDSRTIHCNTPGTSNGSAGAAGCLASSSGSRGEAALGSTASTPSTRQGTAPDQADVLQGSTAPDQADVLQGSTAPGMLRVAAYVCMLPRARADDATVRLRQRACHQGVGSTHWPAPFAATGWVDGPFGKRTAADMEALKLAQQAEDYEMSGDVAASVACWRKAFKLSPAVEELFFRDGTEGDDAVEDDVTAAWFRGLTPTRRRLIGQV